MKKNKGTAVKAKRQKNGDENDPISDDDALNNDALNNDALNNDALDNDTADNDADNGDDEDAFLSFIRSCVMPEDLTKIKNKFEATIELRNNMILNIDQHQPLFDLYLLSPDLVNIVFTWN